MICEVKDIIKSFIEDKQEVTALKNVSADFEEGAFTALSGPSGSGKTTLLNLIGCLDKPTNGKIILDNEDVSQLSQSQLTNYRLYKIGFIFQDYNLIPTLSVTENVEYVLWLQGVSATERRKRSLEVLKQFGIGQLADRRSWQLSRGQQQRVAIARGIVHRPKIVLGDELTANLDHKTGKDLMAFLKSLNKDQGITFLYATHDPVMMEYADNVIRMQDGEVLKGENV